MRFPFQLPKANDFDVVGFGTNAVDYLVRVPEYPKFNSKVELIDHVQAAGGEVASTMTGLARLGLKTAYVGRFGGDQAGIVGMESLMREGVDISYAETIDAAQTQVAFIIIDGRSGERTIIWHRDSNLAYSDVDAPITASIRGRVLHITPHDVAACVKMAQSAIEQKIIISMDVDNVFDGIDDLLPIVDICIASANLPEKLTGIADTKLALLELSARFGCTLIGVTLGDAGSLFLCQNTFIETPGFAVPGGCVDTTGAGDAFRTGFLFGLLTNESVEESATIANAVAALKCRGVGARTTLPSKLELTAFLGTLKIHS